MCSQVWMTFLMHNLVSELKLLFSHHILVKIFFYFFAKNLLQSQTCEYLHNVHIKRPIICPNIYILQNAVYLNKKKYMTCIVGYNTLQHSTDSVCLLLPSTTNTHKGTL
jgi:hypothetical protein